MAQLLDWLAFSGARTSGGDPVSSGAIWFYQPGGGTTPATVYSDVDGTVVATNPVTLDAGGRALVYVTSPVRAVVQDATGADVMDADQADVNRAEAVQVDNTGWSDGYLDGVLSKIFASTGGVDAQYMQSGGATPRTIQSKFSELSVSVKDFGAKGDGLTIDTVGVQAAINRVSFLGGGTVYVPPGTYLIDQTLMLSGVIGVNILGAGPGVSILKNTSGIHNAITMTNGSAEGSISRLTITNSSSSTAHAIDILSASNEVVIDDVSIDSHYIGINITQSGPVTLKDVDILTAVGAGNAGVALTMNGASQVTVLGGTYLEATTGYSMSVLGGTGPLTVVGAAFGTTTNGVNLLDGGNITFLGCQLTGSAVPFSFTNTVMPSSFRQYGNGIDGYTLGLLTGATFTPDLSKGNHIVIDATTTGSAFTVAVPTPPPAATDHGVWFDLVFHAHAGSNITGWGLATGYHVSSGPSVTDTNFTSYRFLWDPNNSVWREISRSVTT